MNAGLTSLPTHIILHAFVFVSVCSLRDTICNTCDYLVPPQYSRSLSGQWLRSGVYLALTLCLCWLSLCLNLSDPTIVTRWYR